MYKQSGLYNKISLHFGNEGTSIRDSLLLRMWIWNKTKANISKLILEGVGRSFFLIAQENGLVQFADGIVGKGLSSRLHLKKTSPVPSIDTKTPQGGDGDGRK